MKCSTPTTLPCMMWRQVGKWLLFAGEVLLCPDRCTCVCKCLAPMVQWHAAELLSCTCCATLQTCAVRKQASQERSPLRALMAHCHFLCL